MQVDKVLSEFDKNKNDKQWYKDYIDSLTTVSFFGSSENTALDKVKLSINYDLFNGKIDKTNFEYVYKPLGENSGDLPADFTNKDIISGKLKVLLGMELDRPFSWRINAVNPEATTRKEQARFGKIKDYVIKQIMQPIQQQIELKYAEQLKGDKLTPDEQNQIKQTIAEESQAMTPAEVLHYMKREHQDPVEIMMNQIFKYILQEQDIKRKFNNGWKHGIISSAQIYWRGIINGKPILKNVNPIDFECASISSDQFVEDGEWAGVNLWLSFSEVVSMFDFTDEELKKLNDLSNNGAADIDWSFDNSNTADKIRVVHRAWKAVTQIGFLAYLDAETGEILERIVGEDYELNEANGDINIEWRAIPEVYEGYRIGRDIYKGMNPVLSQPKDLHNLYNIKLPYSGGFMDNMNSDPTSLVDRISMYQYYYNIIMYRIEMLMSSDKGKILLLNMNLIPNSQKIDLPKWLHYAEALKIGFLNPNEEGNAPNTDISTAAKEIDMSLVSDIEKYVKLAEYVEGRAGHSIGVTKEMEGRFGQYQAVRNAEQSIQQGSYIVEPYFDWHNIIKTNTLSLFVETTALAYSTNEIEALDYILDDFSKEIVKIDKGALSLSKFGLFVANSMDAIRVKEAINNLSLTAMQNQSVDMSDIIKIMKTDSVTEAQEILAVAEERKRNEANEMEKQRMQHEQELQKRIEAENEKIFQREKELIVLKEEERRKTEIQKQTILSLGFAENKDVNDNDVPDVLEVAKFGVETKLKMQKQLLDAQKFEHQKKQDEEKNRLEEKKIKKMGQNKGS